MDKEFLQGRKDLTEPVKVCCICGEPLDNEWGNNPWGAIGEDGEPIEWSEEDRCCDACNMQYVITGRLYLMNKKNK